MSPLAYATAFAGGVVSFLSPCVLPLVPGYLSIVTGLEVAEIGRGAPRNARRVAGRTGLFVAGFGVVFVMLGVSATTVGGVLFDNQATLTRVSGVVLVGMGLFLAASVVLRFPWLFREARFHPATDRFGVFAPVVVGAAFGFGWTPCIGPVLGSILGIAATQDRALAGGTLLAVYAIGLGVPFFVTGLALERLTGAFDWVRRRFAALVLGSATLLVGLGTLLVLDRLLWVTTRVQTALEAVGLGRLVEVG